MNHWHFHPRSIVEIRKHNVRIMVIRGDSIWCDVFLILMEIDPINGVNIYANIIVHITVICDPFLVAGIRITKWFITSSSSLFRALILSYAMWFTYIWREFSKKILEKRIRVFFEVSVELYKFQIIEFRLNV